MKMKRKICPRCRQPIEGYPAISRRDNTTEICSNCGVVEAVEEWFEFVFGKKGEKKK